MRKKIFTFLLALTASIGMMWAETVVVINKSEFTSSGVTKEGVTLALSSGSMTSSDVVAMNGSFEFSTSLGKFTGITIETDANIMEIYEGAYTSAGWPTGDNLGKSAVWTGESETVLISCMVAGMNTITITCTIEPASVDPATSGDGDKLSGAFSVSSTKVVYFSKGNLQYTKSTGKWKIMDHQYDVVETLSQNVGTDYASQDVITLFGWGTSGWESDTRLADFPYYTDYNNADYGVLATKSADETLTDATANGEKGDWGVYNSSDLGAGWRTLTNAEWGYLFNSRTPGNSVNGVSNARYTEATINTDGTAVNGIILFPDDAVMTSVDGVTWGTINGTSAWTTTCTIAGWTALETAGCVFLPAAGDRKGTSVDGVGSDGTYWSSSANSATYAYFLTFSSGYVNSQSYDSRGYGCSVRLVSETAPSGGSTSSETTVTWDLSDMASMGTQGGYFKAKGITLMAYGVDNGMTGDGIYGGAYFGGPFVFTTSLGKFTKIEVTNSYLYDQPAFSGDDWTLDGTNAVWEGTPAALVSLVSNFGGITQIKFTIDPNTSTPANSCGDGLTWAVNDGVLTISYDGVGTGSMDNYDDPLSMPWFGQNITSVVLPEGLISIGQNAFAFINTFSQITLPSTLQYILMNAFSGCGLTSVTIPANVKGISASTFISSQSLATVTFEPTTPPRVGGNAFEYCHNNLIIYYPCESKALYYNDMQADIAYYHDKMYNCPAPPSNLHVTELEVPGSWYHDFTSLTASDFPGFVAASAAEAQAWSGAPASGWSCLIYAFEDDEAKVCYFEDGVFSELGARSDRDDIYYRFDEGYQIYYTGTAPVYTLLSTITLQLENSQFVENHTNPNVASIGKSCNVTYAQYANYIAWKTDPWSSNEMLLVMPKAGYTITKVVFTRDNNPSNKVTVTSAPFTASVTNNDNISKIEVYGEAETPAAPVVVASWTSNECNVVLTNDGKLTVSKNEGDGEMENMNSYQSSKWRCFSNLVTSVEIQEGVTKIGDYAFYNMQNISSVSFPNSLLSIGDGAFFGSPITGNIVIPEHVQTIGSNAFAMIGQSASTVSIPASVTSIGQWAFQNKSTEDNTSTNVITAINVDAANPNYCSVDGILYSKDMTTLIAYPAGKTATEYVIPSTVTEIKSRALYSCVYITTLTIPAVTTLVEYDGYAGMAFSGCYGLTDIYNNATTPQTISCVLSWMDKGQGSINLYVPSGTRAAYEAADGWKDLNIIDSTPAPTTEEVITNEDPENPSYHYSTFFHSTQNYKLTNDGTQAFIADLSGSDLVLTKIAEGAQVIPANTAVILRKSGSADPVVLTPTEENGVSVNPDDNSLEGVDAVTTLESLSINPDNCYVLSGTAQYGVGFYKINANSLKAHKAYVLYNGTAAPARMRFIFNNGQVATDIERVQSDEGVQKRIENGQLIIIRDGVYYNAQGQTVK